jgi:hypothetical protein
VESKEEGGHSDPSFVAEALAFFDAREEAHDGDTHGAGNAAGRLGAHGECEEEKGGYQAPGGLAKCIMPALGDEAPESRRCAHPDELADVLPQGRGLPTPPSCPQEYPGTCAGIPHSESLACSACCGPQNSAKIAPYALPVGDEYKEVVNSRLAAHLSSQALPNTVALLGTEASAHAGTCAWAMLALCHTPPDGQGRNGAAAYHSWPSCQTIAGRATCCSSVIAGSMESACGTEMVA